MIEYNLYYQLIYAMFTITSSQKLERCIQVHVCLILCAGCWTQIENKEKQV